MPPFLLSVRNYANLKWKLIHLLSNLLQKIALLQTHILNYRDIPLFLATHVEAIQDYMDATVFPCSGLKPKQAAFKQRNFKKETDKISRRPIITQSSMWKRGAPGKDIESKITERAIVIHVLVKRRAEAVLHLFLQFHGFHVNYYTIKKQMQRKLKKD